MFAIVSFLFAECIRFKKDLCYVYWILFYIYLIIDIFICDESYSKICWFVVDKPNERKHHKGAIPLVGGISIFAAISVTFLSFLPLTRDLYLYLSCALVLIILGAFDDRLDMQVLKYA